MQIFVVAWCALAGLVCFWLMNLVWSRLKIDKHDKIPWPESLEERHAAWRRNGWLLLTTGVSVGLGFFALSIWFAVHPAR
jgi:hypothetical protein